MAGIEEKSEQDIFDSCIEDSELSAKIHDIIQNIEILSESYLQGLKADTITDLTQQEYNGLLMYIAMNYFRPTKILYKYKQGVSNNKQVVCMYDDDLLYILCEYYIYMSIRYNKMVNCHGFALLIGSDGDTLTRWEGLKEQRPKVYGLTKRLKYEYEKGLVNGAQSGRNPVGFIATLNHYYGWSADNKPTLTVNINRDSKQIMSTFDNSLTDNHS